MTTTRKMVFMMGLPGAGKSTVRNAMFAAQSPVVLDADEFKTQIAGYDPKNAAAVHEASMVLFNNALRTIYDVEDVALVIVDGTGTSAEQMVQRMTTAKAAGWTTELVYVRVALQTAIDRAAQRERQVPVSVIVEKSEVINTSFELSSPYADVVTVVDND